MNSPENTKRQPAETRQLILDATSETILEKGVAGITVAGVAQLAGISKGGLLHHFPTKQHLLDALIVSLHEYFLKKLDQISESDPVEHGRRIRSYLRLATQERGGQSCKLMNVIAVEARDNPVLRAQWRSFLLSLFEEQANKQTDALVLVIVQLAADGLWLAEQEGVFEKFPEFHQQILQRLEEMTYLPGESPAAQQA